MEIELSWIESKEPTWLFTQTNTQRAHNNDRGHRGLSAATDFTVHLCLSVARNCGSCLGAGRQPQTGRISPSSLLFHSGSQVTRKKRKGALLSGKLMSPCGGSFLFGVRRIVQKGYWNKSKQRVWAPCCGYVKLVCIFVHLFYIRCRFCYVCWVLKQMSL